MIRFLEKVRRMNEKDDKINLKEIITSAGVFTLFTIGAIILYDNREKIYKAIRGLKERYNFPADLEEQYKKFEERIFERANQITDERIDRRIEEYMKRSNLTRS